MPPAKKKRRVQAAVSIVQPANQLVKNLSVIIPESVHIGEPIIEVYGPAINGVRAGPTTVMKSFEILDMRTGQQHTARLQALNEARKNLPADLASGIPEIHYINLQPTGITYVQRRILRAAPVQKWSMAPENALTFCASIKSMITVVHRAGLRHRDISPWNVLRSPLGAHLVDWDHHERQQGNLQWAVDAGMESELVDEIALWPADSEKADWARLDALRVWITKRPPPSYIA
jgi:hypothetical protein